MVHAFLILPLFVLILFYVREKTSHRLLNGMLILSTMYYGLMSIYFWSYGQNSTFIGVYWGRIELLYAGALLNWTTVIFMSLIILFEKYFSYIELNKAQKFTFSKKIGSKSLHWMPTFIRIVGWFGTFYVWISGLIYGGLNLGDPIILIAYQFSDLLIPYLIYALVKRGLVKSWIIEILIFLVFALSMGFRYKAMLAIGPVLLWVLGRPSLENDKGNAQLVRKIITVAVASLMLVVFSLLTLSRKKFEGVDFYAVSDQSFDDFLYGIFAEGNIIFGLMSTIEVFWKTGRFVALDPLSDAILDFIPKLLYPDKVVGAHMQLMLEGLGGEEGLISGTAYPYMAEFIMMYGSIGLIIGVVILAWSCNLYARVLRKFSEYYDYDLAGRALLAVFVGYYYFSRGYMPQAIKGFVFILIPYLLLTASRPLNPSKRNK